MLKALTLIADHTCHVQPLVTSLLWHSIAPKSLQVKDLDVRSLVHELLDRPLIHNVIVPASIHFEAIETSVLWVLRYRLGNLVQQLVDRLRRARPEELEPNIGGWLVFELLQALFLELLDAPLFPNHLNVLVVQVDLTVVHNELGSARGRRRLVWEVHDRLVVDI